MKNSSLNFNFKSFLDWKAILLIVVILLLVFFQCSKKPDRDTVVIDKKLYTVVKRTSDSLYRTNKIIEYKTTNQFYTKIIETDTLIQFKDVDTAVILKDYFSKVVTIDTLKLNDSVGYVSITDTITKNRILSRKYFAEIKQLEIHDTVWLAEPMRDKVYFGVTAGVTRNQLPATLGVNMLYQTKNDKIYGIGAGIQNMKAISPYVNASLYWKIKLKK